MALTYKCYKADKHRKRQLVEFLLSQERDYDSHVINKARYETILATEPAGAFRDRITQLLAETNSRIKEIESIVNSTTGLPTQTEIDQIMAAIDAGK